MDRRTFIAGSAALAVAPSLPVEAVETGTYRPTITHDDGRTELGAPCHYKRTGDMVVINLGRVQDIGTGYTFSLPPLR